MEYLQGTSTAHTQEGLRPGCTYQVQVRAINEAGFGPYSPTIDIMTASDVPSAPGVPRAVSRSVNSLVVEWSAPGHDGGRAVTSYRLEAAFCALPFLHVGSFVLFVLSAGSASLEPCCFLLSPPDH